MASFTLKNIPPLVFERLKIRAKKNGRSINSELLSQIEENVMADPLSATEIISIADKYMTEMNQQEWSLDEIDAAKRLGRE
jgi:plasmid stability protein